MAGHEWLARWTASRYQLSRWVDYEDVLAWSRAGLVRAARDFDPGRGLKFATYATHWCRHYAGRFLLTERGRGMAVPVHRPCPARTAELVVRTTHAEEWDAGAEVADHRPPGGDPALRLWFSEEYRDQRRCLTLRHRVVLCLRGCFGLTLEDVAEPLGVTRELVRQVQDEAVRKLAQWRQARSRERQIDSQLAGRATS